MSQLNLVLGTAEFGLRPYGEGVKKAPSEKEILRILNLAWEAGIRKLDTSPSYGCELSLRRLGLGFVSLTKLRDTYLCFDPRTNYNVFYHYRPNEERLDYVVRASVYDLAQIPPKFILSQGDLIVPFNIDNTDFAAYTHHYLRSIFDRGRLLKKGYTVKDCLGFVKRTDTVGAIIGVNSAKELEEILQHV